MKLIDVDDVPQIFVGREKILTRLQKILDNKNSKPFSKLPFVYVMLNTPGIGKTVTIQHFGDRLMHGKPFPVNGDKAKTHHALYLFIKITQEIKDINFFFEMLIDVLLENLKLFHVQFLNFYLFLGKKS